MVSEAAKQLLQFSSAYDSYILFPVDKSQMAVCRSRLNLRKFTRKLYFLKKEYEMDEAEDVE